MNTDIKEQMKAFLGEQEKIDAIRNIPAPVQPYNDKDEQTKVTDVDKPDIKDATADVTIDLNWNRDKSVIELREHLLRLAQNDFDLAVHNASFAGNEGFGDTIGGIVQAIDGGFSKLKKFYYEYILSNLVGFKESEVTKLVKACSAQLEDMLKLNFKEYKDLKVAVPRGFNGKYIPALSSLTTFLDILKVSDRIENKILPILREIVRLTHNNGNGKLTLPYSVQGSSIFSMNIESEFKPTEKFFTSGNNHEAKLDEVVTDFNELRDVCLKLSDADSYLSEAVVVYKQMEDCSELAHNLIKAKAFMDKPMVNYLASILTDIGLCFSLYATTLNDLQRLNHNVYLDVLTVFNKSREKA